MTSSDQSSAPSPAEPTADAGEGSDEVAFGEMPANRFGADVVYRGRAGEHDYLVKVRHRFLDTSLTVVIDGIEHDPKAEQERQKKTETEADTTGSDEPRSEAQESTGETGEAKTEAAPGEGAAGTAGDDLQFRVEEHFTTVYCTVRRPDEDGDPEDAEVIEVRTAGLGGAGEVDVRRVLQRIPLAPEEGSPSAARDRRRTAHPTRYALLAALTKAATYLIPLLGIAALLSGLLRPVREWIRSVVTPVIDRILDVVRPILEWIDELLRPIREFIDALTRPIREFIASLLRPVRDLLVWLRDLLLGWIPDLSLPFDIPDWVSSILVPVAVVLIVFTMTSVRIRRRRRRLEEARTAADTEPSTRPSPPDPATEDPREQADMASSEPTVAEDPQDPEPRTRTGGPGAEPEQTGPSGADGNSSTS